MAIFIKIHQNCHNSKKNGFFTSCEVKTTKMTFDYIRKIYFFSWYYL